MTWIENSSKCIIAYLMARRRPSKQILFCKQIDIGIVIQSQL
jgi:hypothetical protein